MAVFEKDGKTYAFSIGSVKDGNYKFYSDDMLFIQDPHELYRTGPRISGQPSISIKSRRG